MGASILGFFWESGSWDRSWVGCFIRWRFWVSLGSLIISYVVILPDSDLVERFWGSCSSSMLGSQISWTWFDEQISNSGVNPWCIFLTCLAQFLPNMSFIHSLHCLLVFLFFFRSAILWCLFSWCLLLILFKTKCWKKRTKSLVESQVVRFEYCELQGCVEKRFGSL